MLIESNWKTKLLRYKQALHNLQGRNMNIMWGKHQFDERVIIIIINFVNDRVTEKARPANVLPYIHTHTT